MPRTNLYLPIYLPWVPAYGGKQRVAQVASREMAAWSLYHIGTWQTACYLLYETTPAESIKMVGVHFPPQKISHSFYTSSTLGLP